INAFYPADAVAAAGKFVGSGRFKLDASPALHLGLKYIHANALKGVFGLGIFTVGTVSPVTLGCYHGFCYRQRVLQRNIAKLARGAGVGIFVAVLNRQTAADQ